MRHCSLYFPDVESISLFIQDQEISNVEINSIEQSVRGNLSDDEIEIACKSYNAIEFHNSVLKPSMYTLQSIYKPN